MSLEHAQASETTEAKFNRLAAEWKSQSSVLSSPTEIAMLPAYQQIIGMGEQAIPLILGELKSEPDLWFWALKAISGEDPVPAEAAGNIDAMVHHWIKWGVENGYLAA